MKKLVNLCILLGLFNLTCAQHTNKVKGYSIDQPNESSNISAADDGNIVSWGIIVAANLTKLSGKDLDYIFADNTTTYKQGFQIGFYTYTRINKHIGLGHEILFNQRRTTINLNDEYNKTYPGVLNRNYMDFIPANLNVQLGGLKLYVGPYISALLTANLQRKNENGHLFKDKRIFGDPSNDESEYKYLQKMDFGSHIGLTYQYKLGIAIGFSYSYGFTDLFQYANSYGDGDTKNKIKIYNRQVAISLACPLHL